jgi:long-chain acyl-CoA synthetase
MGQGSLDVARILDGVRVVVLGGTGFLGKVFWSMLIDRYPNIGRVYVVVRPKSALTPDARFWTEVAPSEALEPLRRAHGRNFEAFLRSKVVAVDGDMGRPMCGLEETLVRQLKGTIAAVVNVAGVVDFNPPLDDALEANAFGAQNVAQLARALGGVPILHTSTCYVAGTRKGPILEEDPRLQPFPRSGELGAELWDPDREIAECLDLVAQAKQRSDDAFRQSEFAQRARANLLGRDEPVHGEAYTRELAHVKRKFVRERLVEAGLDRAAHWGWPNIYLYTKAIGEQVIARSGLPFAIARPACCESCVAFPVPGYNEGGNTSAPLIYLMMKGQMQILAQHVPLDLIPTDYVVAGMIMALGELLEGTAAPVYQFGASDVNPCTAQRFGELVGLYKRKFYQRNRGNPLLNALQARLEPSFVDRARFDAMGPPAIESVTRELASLVKRTVPALAPAARALEALSKREKKIGETQHLFEPFSAKLNGPFDCSNTRAAYARLSDEDKRKLPWAPASIDWADWMMNIHMPAIEKRIIPAIDRRLSRDPRRLATHATLVSLIDEMAERHGLAIALQFMTAEGLTRISFADVKQGADAMAARLAGAGVGLGDRVALSGRNHPDWAVAYFGIVRAGAVAVPIDPALDASGWHRVLVESGARVVVWDETVERRDEVVAAHCAAGGDVLAFDFHAAVLPDGDLAAPEVTVAPDDVASLLFVNEGAEAFKAVPVTHAKLTSLLASLAPVFPLSNGDAVLSVLPLHHTFEFTCGLLLPLSRGARVVHVGDMTDDSIAEGLRLSRAKAMVGVPALWQRLERQILQRVDARGPHYRALFDVAVDVNRWLGANVGVDMGRLLFGAVHEQLGGRVRWLISGGAALPRETQERFAGLGFALRQGGGWTEEQATDSAVAALPSARADADADADRAVAQDVSLHNPPLVLPHAVQEAGKAIIGKLQDVFYGEVMKPQVFGRAYIPHNRNVIVVANHASHLDMGFVRYALGRYGDDIVSLAAQDYFFESGMKRAFFENLTNLKAIDRRSSLRQSLRQASEVIERGKTVLIFPEGTRSASGEIQEFKSLVGYLALAHNVDILPVHLFGTHAAMAKGSPVPTRRAIVARIGPPLCASDLSRLTEGMTPAQCAREVARLAQAAVLALGAGQVLDLTHARRGAQLLPEQEHPLVKLFAELEAKFRAGEVEKPVSYYVSLGNDQLAKWTVRVDSVACDVRPGKPDGGQADCVLKTSPEIFTKIVRESYIPSAADFISGAVKSNDVALLMTFQKVFQLDQAS